MFQYWETNNEEKTYHTTDGKHRGKHLPTGDCMLKFGTRNGSTLTPNVNDIFAAAEQLFWVFNCFSQRLLFERLAEAAAEHRHNRHTVLSTRNAEH